MSVAGSYKYGNSVACCAFYIDPTCIVFMAQPSAVEENINRRPTRLPTMNLVASPDPASGNTTFQRSQNEKPAGHIVRSILPDRYEHQQRTLSTLVLAGTFMAGVEGQILSIILTLEDGSRLKIGALCFAILGVVTTSFAALYSAVTYIWLRGSWTPGPKQFHEWVAGCVGMMVRWCSSFLVVGTYAGFVSLILFFFKRSPIGVAVFAITIVFLAGLFPMIWGFYYWLGLSQGWLVWTPECRYPVRTTSLPPGENSELGCGTQLSVPAGKDCGGR
ncbi:hypothetical protein MVEN_00802400 [Mycena venus]|uniref:Uncharacterized protein n=1 Tax=Mycena venus TaxID=2733690 RepID=A0A8H6YGF1_9AGAR|nr:hypothetical protein MVEN_00802400 [Mycena venus]